MKVLKNVNIIDFFNKQLLTDKVIIIDNDRIQAIHNVEQKEFILNKAEVYDLKGKYVIPGIINLHQHYIFKRGYGPIRDQLTLPVPVLAIRALKNALAEFKQGITTTRVLGSFNDIDRSLKYLFKYKYIIGPDLFISGGALVTSGSHSSQMAQRVDGIEEIRKASRKKTLYADWIKTFASYDPIEPLSGNKEYSRPEISMEEIKVMCEEAHNAGKKVAAHAIGSESINNAVEAGVDTIEHGIYLTKEIASKMKQKEITLVPTISAYYENINPNYNRGDRWISLHKPLVDAHKESINIAASMGLEMALGLDSLGKIEQEIEFIKELADYDEYDVLKFCTYNGAKVLGINEDYGSIEEGKIADILILNQNPLDNIQGIRDIHKIIKDGEILDVDDIKIKTDFESASYNSMIPELLK
ncbi:amidohydrolase family protein [Virgibacillus sp. W0181]|uniref:metal-dependent hydrolase family protein n=1 Tax=Virgibacillus sp. W0181 TaxID=3391581 RepID=UPI003F47F161